MNYPKIILVGFISAFVAVLTSVLGVTGTIIGSVISSVLYNTLSEALEKPVSEASFSRDFEWEIAYVFPLIVIALIQVLFILSLLSKWGFLPYTFLSAYVSLQGVAGNNLYRILGCALIIISIYPFVLKPDFIKKAHGAIIAFVGLIFLARGFIDYGNAVTNMYDDIFINFDFPIAVIALILLVFVIIRVLRLANDSEKEFKVVKRQINENTNKVHRVPDKSVHGNGNYQKSPGYKADYPKNIRRRNNYSKPKADRKSEVTFSNRIDTSSSSGINESSENIRFESNDLLDEYKK